MTERVQSLIGPSDIAELADVSRGAVSNWRKRNQDFPDAVGGTDSNPLFALDDVLAWLRARGHKVTTGVEDALWASLNTVRGNLSPDGLAQLALTLACAVKDSHGSLVQATKDGELLNALGQSALALSQRDLLPDNAMGYTMELGEAKLAPIILAIDKIPHADRAEVIDAILERVTRAQIKLGTNIGFVDSRVSAMLAALTDLHPRATTFYDPACGIASSLVDIGVEQPGARLFGQEISQQQTLIGRQRAFLRDLQLEVKTGDTLLDDRFHELHADVVILDPPYGIRFDSSTAFSDVRYAFGTPPKSSADLAWVQHAVAHLADDGIAFVITPMGALMRSGVEQSIRKELLREGCIRAIVSLPGRMNPQTSIPLALWVLQRPTRNADSVFLIDASGHPAPERHLTAWLQRDGIRIPVLNGEVAVMDLMKDDANLTPQRWLEFSEVSPESVLSSFQETSRSVTDSISDVLTLTQALKSPFNMPRARTVTVAELIDQSVVEVTLGRVKPNERGMDGPSQVEPVSGLVTTRHVRAGKLPTFTNSGGFETAQADLTQPGDVLLITWDHISAILDEEGGRSIASGVYRVRVTKPEVLSPEYLVGVIAGSWNNRFLSGSTIQRVNPKELEVPLVSLADQAHLADRFSKARELRALAAVMDDSAEKLETALRDAVRHGVSLSGSDGIR